MKLGVMGKKIGMTQVFDEEGRALAVTVVKFGENLVTQKISVDKNGYQAVQVGGFVVKEKRLNKPEMGALKKNSMPPVKPLVEYRVDDSTPFEVGSPLKVDDILKVGMLVDIRGKGIGKGFQGTIKRYNAHRGPMAHGSKFHRSMGSIGAGTTPGRVFRGLPMPGQMGNKNVCVRHIKVVKIDLEKSLILVHGSVPGADETIVTIHPSIVEWNKERVTKGKRPKFSGRANKT
jgi:large subunit ribosomal protein L3